MAEYTAEYSVFMNTGLDLALPPDTSATADVPPRCKPRPPQGEGAARRLQGAGGEVGHRLGQLRRLGRRARSGRLERGRRAARREGARVAEGLRVRDTKGEG